MTFQPMYYIYGYDWSALMVVRDCDQKYNAIQLTMRTYNYIKSSVWTRSYMYVWVYRKHLWFNWTKFWYRRGCLYYVIVWQVRITMILYINEAKIMNETFYRTVINLEKTKNNFIVIRFSFFSRWIAIDFSCALSTKIPTFL